MSEHQTTVVFEQELGTVTHSPVGKTSQFAACMHLIVKHADTYGPEGASPLVYRFDDYTVTISCGE